MSKKYRWCEASGPVPYPDDSGRMLDNYDELVEGDGWSALADLGFVEEVEAPAKKAAPKKAATKKAATKKAATPMPEATPAPPEPDPLPEPSPLPEPEPEAKEEPDTKPEAKEEPDTKPEGYKTVSEMASEAAANSTDEPATVAGQAKKVLSKRKSKAKKKK